VTRGNGNASSFLEKNTKELLLIGDATELTLLTRLALLTRALKVTGKDFLFVLFKNEVLHYFILQSSRH
jgi:hypothetical protein